MAVTDGNTLELNSAASEDPDEQVANSDIDDRMNSDADEASQRSDGTAIDDSHASAPEVLAVAPGEADSRSGRRLSINVSARSLVYAALVAVLVGALATFVWLYVDARRDLDAAGRKTDSDAHAEQVALDYAINAATMNFEDMNAWKNHLVAGTSPELNDRLTQAADSMQQILVPLQWVSTAQPLVAKVRSDAGGIYTVDCFVSVQTKTVQAPEALQSTATYSLTLDSTKNWQVTDVGGIGAVVVPK